MFSPPENKILFYSRLSCDRQTDKYQHLETAGRLIDVTKQLAVKTLFGGYQESCDICEGDGQPTVSVPVSLCVWTKPVSVYVCRHLLFLAGGS
jgi:hypothetical protein